MYVWLEEERFGSRKGQSKDLGIGELKGVFETGRITNESTGIP